MAVSRLVLVAFAAVLAMVIVVRADEGVHDHIREHMPMIDDMYNDDIYFFSLHDTNADGHLDGHEMRVALLDSHGHQREQKSLEQVENRVDAILAKDDRNGDGRISFAEFNLMSFYSKY